MKRSILLVSTITTLCAMSCSLLAAEELLPGQIDFGNLAPANAGSEYVEVNLPANVISLAARLVQKDDKDAARLLNGLKLVHVTAIGVNDENRGDLQKQVAKVQGQLSSKGWQQLVKAQQHSKQAGIYLKMDDKGTVQGLAVAAMEPRKGAVFVNIVGDIKPDDLARIGERLHIDPLKKLGEAEEK